MIANNYFRCMLSETMQQEDPFIKQHIMKEKNVEGTIATKRGTNRL